MASFVILASFGRSPPSRRVDSNENPTAHSLAPFLSTWPVVTDFQPLSGSLCWKYQTPLSACRRSVPRPTRNRFFGSLLQRGTCPSPARRRHIGRSIYLL